MFQFSQFSHSVVSDSLQTHGLQHARFPCPSSWWFHRTISSSIMTFSSNSVVSDSVRPHRRQPIRLPHPWDSPGNNTRVGCHFLLQYTKVRSESEVAQSCLTLHDPMDCSLPGSSVHGIFQARALEWGAITFSEWVHYTLHKCLLHKWVKTNDSLNVKHWGVFLTWWSLMI